jgi:hypothetical protein
MGYGFGHSIYLDFSPGGDTIIGYTILHQVN